MKVTTISNYNNNPISYPNYLTAVFIDQTEKKKPKWRGGKGGGGGAPNKTGWGSFRSIKDI